MKKLIASEFIQHRIFMGRLPYNEDLITSIENFCREANVKTGEFSAIGALSSVTTGIYDQKQQVYVTAVEKGEFEILSCTGNISINDDAPIAHAHIILCGEDGRTFGGHLFSESILFAGEIVLRELAGETLTRVYDETTGLMLWKQ